MHKNFCKLDFKHLKTNSSSKTDNAENNDSTQHALGPQLINGRPDDTLQVTFV